MENKTNGSVDTKNLLENGQFPDPADWAVADVVDYFKAAGFEEQATAFQDQWTWRRLDPNAGSFIHNQGIRCVLGVGRSIGELNRGEDPKSWSRDKAGSRYQRDVERDWGTMRSRT
uniref:Sterile alpha motif domain containing 13 n=1 Tax=Scleropages formosus TaxID=113540 RepID=A0A8C9V5Q4_SCLFO